ncbi:MAG: alpha/beta fold hydrolase [Microlunatus sp.]
MRSARAAAQPLLDGLPGIDPSWSRRIDVPDADGVVRTWHLLERPARPSVEPPTGTSSQAQAPIGTMICLHGNPTWSYLWRRFLELAPDGWRVIAPDQLSMGWSERLERPRSLTQRIDDLDRLTDALDITGPVVAVAHDWGGPVLLGWAERHRDLLAGIVLTNTGVAIPAGTTLSPLIRIARSAPLLESVCVRTQTFVRGATAISRPSLPKEIRDAYAAPYLIAARRRAVRDFVADIPLESDHPSRAILDEVVDGLATLARVPTLLAWGPRDPVFTIRYLHDLRRRLPQADIQLYPAASHLVTEDAPTAAADIWEWVQRLPRSLPSDSAGPGPDHDDSTNSGPDLPPTADPGSEVGTQVRPLWAGLSDRADDPATAVAELGPRGITPISFAALEHRVADLTTGLLRAGVGPGQRVAVLVRPGIDLTVAVYACWRAGAAIVVADAGLGLRSLGRALRSADPDHLIAIPAGLTAAHALRVPGHRIVAGDLPPIMRARMRVSHTLAELEELGRHTHQLDRQAALSGQGEQDEHDAAEQSTIPPLPSPDAEAAVLFTSGATGPAKGVVYRHRQLAAQVELFGRVANLEPGARLVAAFAPFALYAPALGAAAAVPDMDVTKPGTLKATALAEAVSTIDATVVFASPAALRNVVATADQLTEDLRAQLRSVRTLLSAGAPVPLPLLRQVQTLLPNAELHTPYGMTEALPATDVTMAEIEQAIADAGEQANGVCVGKPLPGVRIGIAPLDPDGWPADEPADIAGRTGEICISAAHVKDHYDRLWLTQQRSVTAGQHPDGQQTGAQPTDGPRTDWHRTGDVGHLDAQGRLWVEGRLVHVISGPTGPITPVGIEQRVEAVPEVELAAAVGVGPAGTQQTVVVLVPTAGASPRRPLAPAALASSVRQAAGSPIAAVLVTDRLPVDIRHASKIDRARVAQWAERVLAGDSLLSRGRRP